MNTVRLILLRRWWLGQLFSLWAAFAVARVSAQDTQPPLLSFAPLQDNDTVTDLAAIGGTVTDDSGTVASVTFSVHELAHNGGNGRWWNGTAWQTDPVALAGVVSDTSWSRASAVTLPPLNSGLRFEVTATARDAADNVTTKTVTVRAAIPTLTWDPGTTHEGTEVLAQPHVLGGSHIFRIVTQNTAVRAWRTALKVTAGEANVYLGSGAPPVIGSAFAASARVGSDGFVLAEHQFSENQEWFIQVDSQPGATWNLVSGEAFVLNLGALPEAGTTGDTEVTIGPEGWRFFRTVAPANTLAWRLWLHDFNGRLHVRKGFAAMDSNAELKQDNAMLLVPDYLQADTTYLVGVPGNPGTAFTLQSKQQPITTVGFNSTQPGVNVTGFPYTTYRVEVPIQQIAWEVRTAPTAGDPNVALRRGLVPNEFNNDAFSEVAGAVEDSVTLVPPSLSDGTFYITTYGAAPYTFTLHNGEPTITPRLYEAVTVNDAPNRAGWRYYVVDDIPDQLGTLGWDLLLANQKPGAEIALRRNAVPGRWRYRTGGNEYLGPSYVDYSDTRGFLQRSGHQADIWYIGIYQPDTSLGAFKLTTSAFDPTPINFGDSITPVAGQLAGRWQFFRVDVPEQFSGWDVRLVNVTSGSPHLTLRRDLLPDVISASLPNNATEWVTGYNWGSGYDWTQLYRDPDGSDVSFRVLTVGRDNPLQPGTYYLGVRDDNFTTTPASYQLVARGIGAGFPIPVADLDFDGPGGKVVNNTGLAPREAAYYRVVIPPNQTSWKVRLTPTTGEAMLLLEEAVLPNVVTGGFNIRDGGRRLVKAGPEQYLLLPETDQPFITAGPHHLAVVSEGINPDRSTGTIGTGSVTYMLESLGAAPVTVVGTGTVLPPGSPALIQPVSLAGGEVKLFQFTVPENTPALEVRLRNRVGRPSFTVRAGEQPSYPHVPAFLGDFYGADFGWFLNRFEEFDVVTIANPVPGRYTVTVKAEDTVDSTYPDSAADLTIQAVAPAELAFDGGTVEVSEQEGSSWRYFTVNVPALPEVLGWDLRITDISGGEPRFVIRRELLPDSLQGDFNLNNREWPVGTQSNPYHDWTSISLNSDGSNADSRVFAAGIGNPLTPGVYRVGVFNSVPVGGAAATYKLRSRGIGAGQSIPINNLAFTGGHVEIPSLAPREAAYYRVVVPPNTPTWKLRLAPTSGEGLLLVQAGFVPHVQLQTPASTRDTYGIRATKPGNEHFSAFPPEGQDFLVEGVNYVVVVSEGSGGQPGSSVGTSPAAFQLDSYGASPVAELGNVPAPGAGQIARPITLEGGEVQLLHFRVTTAVPSLELRLDNRVGNPMLVLRPGLNVPQPQVEAFDYYGVENGWYSQRQATGGFDPVALITVANPPLGDYTLTVRAGYKDTTYVDATANLTIQAVGAVPLAFDGGHVDVSNHPPGSWRFFSVEVPANALGWDLRLNDITGGNAQLYVRRDALPDFNAPGVLLWADAWASGQQLFPIGDFTGLSGLIPASQSPAGHSVVVGRGAPTEPGTYSVGVYVDDFSAATSYTLLSRGIGGAYSIPVTPLTFAGGSASHPGLAPREVAWFSVAVPAGVPSAQIKLDASQGGEALLVLRRDFLPNIVADNPDNSVNGLGRQMTKDGNEHFLMLPGEGEITLSGGTYYLGVVSTGVGPANGYIGTGLSPFTIHSLGVAPVTSLGLVPVLGGMISQAVAVEGGQSKLFRFEMPTSVEWAEVRLASRLGWPAMALRQGSPMPNPNSPMRPIGRGYGNDGGHYSNRRDDPFLLTLVRPEAGLWSLTVKGEYGNSAQPPDASAVLQVEQRTPAPLAFVGGSVSATLADNQRTFYKVEVPAGVLGWKLGLDIANGTPTVRARRGVLPSDEEPGFVAFGAPSIVIAPPVLQPGTWYVEVRGGGVSDFTLYSGPVELVRPAWAMPAFGGPVTTPGLPANGSLFADSGVDASGNPLPVDQGTDLGNGDFHYYSFNVPAGNGGLLRGELFAISGNPDAYVRSGDVPTLSHGSFSQGQLHDFSLTGTGSEYGNWVPLDGRTEIELAPGPWYVAVRANASNVRYRLRLSVGTVTVLTPGTPVANQSIAAGDWRYYRFAVPANAPQTTTVTWGAQQGDADLYVRDTLPPGEPNIINYGPRDWGFDRKNFGPYSTFPTQGSHALTVPPVRPGSVYYLGFRAVNDATFTVKVDFSPATIDVPHVVNFYGGSKTVTIPPKGRVNLRVPVPADATSWRHSAQHLAAVNLYLDQGTLPLFGPGNPAGYIFGRENFGDNSLVQFLYGWPWIANVDYFFTAENTSNDPQQFTLQMDGRNAATDDTDLDGLPDSWELNYFGNLNQNGTGDADGDGVDNATELAEATNPNSAGSLRPRVSTFVSGGGRIVKEPDLPSYDNGQVVRLFAVPDSGFAFNHWEVDGGSPNANPLILTLNASKSVTAVFLSGEIPLVASAPAIVGGGSGFQAAFSGPPASALVIEASADLETWSEVHRESPFTGSFLYEVSELIGDGRFFRARIVP